MTQMATIGKQLDAAFPIGLDREPRFRTPYAIAQPWGVRTMSSRMMGVPAALMRTGRRHDDRRGGSRAAGGVAPISRT